MSRYAISDIHGCAKTFQLALDRIGLEQEDELYLVGDYIDRGPDSGGVIDEILRLREEGYQVICLRGNHEQMYLDSYAQSLLRDKYWDFPSETVASFGVGHIRDTPQRYLDFMEQTQYYHLLPDYILAHAGLKFGMQDPLEDVESMLWIRYWYDTIDREWLGDRLIVHGHTPTRMPVIRAGMNQLENCPVINIDAGCPYQSNGLGHLCVLNMDQRSVQFYRRIENM